LGKIVTEREREKSKKIEGDREYEKT
jgi:hypothetical protein